MSDPYVGEIRMFGGNFAPQGWAFCDGTLLSIAENDALFSLIGTTYGGDGQSTFGLPDLRGRVPIHQGQGAGLAQYVIGENGGSETVTLTMAQIPAHTHVVRGTDLPGAQSSPANGLWAASNLNQYSTNSANAAMSPRALAMSGGSQPHDNMLPFQCVSFIIALFGIYPPRN